MWYHEKEGGVILQIKVISSAKRTAIVKGHPPALSGADADFLTIKITAAPVHGQANNSLRKILAKKLSLAPSDVMIVRGQTNNIKIIFVPVSADQIKAVFEE